jgi:hypothetical protein
VWRVRSQAFRIFVFDTPVGYADITFQLSCNYAALLWPFILLFRQSVKSANKKTNLCVHFSVLKYHFSNFFVVSFSKDFFTASLPLRTHFKFSLSRLTLRTMQCQIFKRCRTRKRLCFCDGQNKRRTLTSICPTFWHYFLFLF